MDALTGGDLFLFEGFRLDRQARVLFRRDVAGAFVPIAVGSRALDVLDVLVGRAGDLVSRDEFMTAVWPATVVEDTNLNMQIAALRRTLDEGRADGSCIQTIPGRGYRFAIPVIRVESALPSSGRPTGNGAGGPVALQPEPENPAPPSRSGTTPPVIPARERKWLWCGCLGVVAGALCLLAVAITGSNWQLRQPEAAGPTPRLSIVVLPFTDLSDDADQRQFASSITEDLTADLSLISDMRVTSRNTAFTYGNKFVDTNRIGRELNVRYVLEGSVQRSGNQMRVNAQLVDVETDFNLWAERFDGDIGDLFALQNEITRRLANALGDELIAAEALRPTERPDALGYILRGRAAGLRLPSRENFAEQISLFEHALALDPQSVEGQSRLAIALAGRVLNGVTDAAAADLARAEGLVGQALAASPRYSFAHHTKATVLRAQNRCEEAIPEYETALALNRNPAYALIGLAGVRSSRVRWTRRSRSCSKPSASAPRSRRWPVIRPDWDCASAAIAHRRGDPMARKSTHGHPCHTVPSSRLASAYALKAKPNAPPPNSPKPAGWTAMVAICSIARINQRVLWVPKIRCFV